MYVFVVDGTITKGKEGITRGEFDRLQDFNVQGNSKINARKEKEKK